MRAADRQALRRLIAGFFLWALGFILLYSFQALGCAYNWPAHRAILTGTYLAILVPLALLGLRPNSSAEHTQTALSRSALWANRAALLSAILIFFPVTFASTCI